eukprot:SAG31_NODE_2770_length_5116_cov_3.834164_7_plen_153_part_00
MGAVYPHSRRLASYFSGPHSSYCTHGRVSPVRSWAAARAAHVPRNRNSHNPRLLCCPYPVRGSLLPRSSDTAAQKSVYSSTGAGIPLRVVRAVHAGDPRWPRQIITAAACCSCLTERRYAPSLVSRCVFARARLRTLLADLPCSSCIVLVLG